MQVVAVPYKEKGSLRREKSWRSESEIFRHTAWIVFTPLGRAWFILVVYSLCKNIFSIKNRTSVVSTCSILFPHDSTAFPVQNFFVFPQPKLHSLVLLRLYPTRQVNISLRLQSWRINRGPVNRLSLINSSKLFCSRFEGPSIDITQHCVTPVPGPRHAHVRRRRLLPLVSLPHLLVSNITLSD